MSDYVLRHLSDATVRRQLPEVIRQERGCTARVVAYIAEFDVRRLYRTDGYPDMFTYCVEVLHYSNDETWRRVRAAGAARQFPVIFDMLGDGRLHLTAVCLLVPFLDSGSVDELLAAAVHKSKRAIEQMLAERFPQPDLPTRIVALATPSGTGTLSAIPASVETVPDLAPEPCAVAPAREHKVAPTKLAPLAPQRFGLQVTIDQETHALLLRAQDLLSHQVPDGSVAAVLRRVFEIAVPRLESRKFGSGKIRAGSKSLVERSRYIPADVRHAVAKRDGHRCTFVGDNGHRCEAQRFLEFDHIEPFSLGGGRTISNLRLRCRAHNQLEAERALGSASLRRHGG